MVKIMDPEKAEARRRETAPSAESIAAAKAYIEEKEAADAARFPGGKVFPVPDVPYDL